MRFSAIIPILLGLAALVLSMLCLFAGSSPTFLEGLETAPIITLNTSQVGQGLLSSEIVTSNLDDRVSRILELIPENVQDAAEDILNTAARRLGLRDYYTAHIMNYCEGFYLPIAVPNATVSQGDIEADTVYCSPRSTSPAFDPRVALQRNLNESGNSDISIEDLNWPSQIDDGLRALHMAQRAVFILYCVSIALIALATLGAIVALFFSGRMSACGMFVLSLLAFIAIGVASGIITAVGVIGVRVLNDYAEQVGISAQRGNRFLGLTWGATAAMLVSVIWWSVDCCVGRRNRGRKAASEKNPY